MKIPNPTNLIHLGRALIAANRPEIMYGASIVSTVSGVILAARGGYKSGYDIAERDIQLQVAGEAKLDHKQIAQLTWLNYLPAAGATGVALGSTTGLHLVHVKEKKQLATAALMAVEEIKRDANAYKKDVVESLGLAKSEDPKDLEKAAKQSGVAKVMHRDGEIEELYLVRDMKTQRDFWSNRQRVEEALLEVNKRLNFEDTELNCFYSMANMGTIPDGEDIGWNAGDVLGLEWDTTVTDKGQPCRTFLITPGADNTLGTRS